MPTDLPAHPDNREQCGDCDYAGLWLCLHNDQTGQWGRYGPCEWPDCYGICQFEAICTCSCHEGSDDD